MTRVSEVKASILIIEDDPTAREQMARMLQELGYLPVCAGSGETGLLALATQAPSVVLLDLHPPRGDGLGLLQRIKHQAPETTVIVASGHGGVGSIVQAMKLGAADFLTKPFGSQELALVLASSSEQRGLHRKLPLDPTQPPALPDDQDGSLWMGGTFQGKLQALIGQVNDTNTTILLQGESGVGKGVVAQLIHAGSSRRHRPFVKVNCAAVPAELLESELFGYERGAFTGATRRKPGKFELAHGGTLLLDDVADLPLGLQAKLLHVLQDGEYSRLGGARDIRVDTRIIATANRDLESAVQDGLFRQDLYYRLNVVNILIPPLRERREEIPALAEHFRQRWARRYNRNAPPLSPATVARFSRYAWPGNVRELENVVKRIVILGTEDFLSSTCPLPKSTPPATVTPRPSPAGSPDGGLKEVVRRAAREVERSLLKAVLEETRWNRAEAARRLQISYKALLYKIRACGL